ncbi:MAG TPA: cobalt transporter CbiM [Armatimonadota bacterium]|nr:cobalt transporter CbiM [Armatimonadota bacterium]
MHIPDGYLGPQTYGAAYALMAPLWAAASRIVGRTLRSRQVPLLALGAAFSFVIMMFNVPIPGGTTGHAVGAVLVAVLLGPWAAVIAVSVALIVQALLFCDGGITAIGANCLNMAVIMPFAGYGVYRLIAGRSALTSRRRWLGAAIGGYVGLNAAALAAAVEFGLQPLIAHNAAGRALYAPYPLSVAVPVMAAEHLLVFGLVEAVVTGLVVAYLQRAEPALLRAPSAPETTRHGAQPPPAVSGTCAMAGEPQAQP